MFTPLIIPPLWLLWPIIIILLGGLILKLKPGKAVKIAIFGSRGSGKTTLWKQLQKKCDDYSYHSTMDINEIDSFDIEYGDRKKRISKSRDYGGSDVLVKYYEENITSGTYIYYLIDLTKLNDFRRETTARLTKILKVIKDNDISDSVGMTLVATHYREYEALNPGKNKQDARNDLIAILNLRDKKFSSFTDSIMVAELTDENDIQQFFEQIVEFN